MFTLGDHRRRLLLRAGFLLLGALPLGYTVGSIVVTRSPWYHTLRLVELQRAIEKHTGLSASVQGAELGPGGSWHLARIDLSDPEAGQRIATVRSVAYRRHDARHVVLMEALEVVEPELVRARQRLFWAGMRRSFADGETVELIANQVTVLGTTGPRSYRQTRLEMVHQNRSTRAALTLIPLDAPVSSQPVELRWMRSLDSEPHASVWELKTGNRPLPCRHLASWWEPLGTFGSEATFDGLLWLRQLDRDQRITDLEVAGSLRKVELDRLVTYRFPHKLSGLADILLRRCLVRNGRLAEWSGSLRCRSGVISRSLVESAAQRLGLKTTWMPGAAPTLVRFEQLAADFRVQASGLQLAGSCDAEQPNVLLAGTDLQVSATTDTVPVTALVATLAPDQRIQVPASRQTEQLLKWLPLPPLDTASRSLPYVPLRLNSQ